MAYTVPVAVAKNDRLQYKVFCDPNSPYLQPPHAWQPGEPYAMVDRPTLESRLSQMLALLERGAWSYLKGASPANQGGAAQTNTPNWVMDSTWFPSGGGAQYDYRIVDQMGKVWKYPWLQFDLTHFDMVAIEACVNMNCLSYGDCKGLNVPALVNQYKQAYIDWLRSVKADSTGMVPAGSTAPGATLYDYAIGTYPPAVLPVTSTGTPAPGQPGYFQLPNYTVNPAGGGTVTQPNTTPNVLNNVAPPLTGPINTNTGGNVLNPPTNYGTPVTLTNGTTTGTPALTNNGGAGMQIGGVDVNQWMKDNWMILAGAGGLLLLLSMSKR